MNLIRSLHQFVYNRYVRVDHAQEMQERIDALKARGLIVGRNFNLQNGVEIDWSHTWHIIIGDDVTIAPRVIILAHDTSTNQALGYTRIGKVNIGDRVFIGASSIILPGVVIGNDVIIGAGSVVSRDVPDGVVAAGNPAKVICSMSDWLTRKRHEMEQSPSFGEEYTTRGNISDTMKAEMNERMAARIGYII